MIYQLTYKSSVASNHFFFDIKEMRWYCVIVFDSRQMTLFEKYSENMNKTNCEPFEYTLPTTFNYLDKGDLFVTLGKIENEIILEIFNKI